jgi:hypothetical protein
MNSHGTQARVTGRLVGLEILERSPLSSKDGDSSVYKELSNKFAWSIRSTLRSMGADEGFVLELSQRLTLVVMANRERKLF